MAAAVNGQEVDRATVGRVGGSNVALERQTCGERPASCSLLIAVRVAKECERVARRSTALSPSPSSAASRDWPMRSMPMSRGSAWGASRRSAALTSSRRLVHPFLGRTRYPRREGNRAPAAPCRRLPPAAPLPCGCAAAPRRIVPRSLRRGRPTRAGGRGCAGRRASPASRSASVTTVRGAVVIAGVGQRVAQEGCVADANREVPGAVPLLLRGSARRCGPRGPAAPSAA